MSFHFALTHFALSQGQSDVNQFGIVFSSIFIILVNVFVVILVLKLVFPGDIALGRFLKTGFNDTVAIYGLLLQTLRKI